MVGKLQQAAQQQWKPGLHSGLAHHLVLKEIRSALHADWHGRTAHSSHKPVLIASNDPTIEAGLPRWMTSGETDGKTVNRYIITEKERGLILSDLVSTGEMLVASSMMRCQSGSSPSWAESMAGADWPGWEYLLWFRLGEPRFLVGMVVGT